jgi:CRP-like cAMP-binding protein
MHQIPCGNFTRNKMNEQINKIFKSILPSLTDSEIAKLIDQGKVNSIPQGECFIQAGHIPKKFGIIIEGLVRYFYTDSQGREFTKAFLSENAAVSSYTSMKERTPSLFSIQALTPTIVLEINYEHWLEIRQSNEKWNLFLIALLEKGYAMKEKRERHLLLLDAESRYRIFREEFHAVESSIKQHLIASYIGITPVALSRIRKKMGLINLC